MALHSINGKTPSRDNLEQRSGSGTFGVTNVKQGNGSIGRVIIKDGTIIVNDGTNDRILIGFLKDGF